MRNRQGLDNIFYTYVILWLLLSIILLAVSITRLTNDNKEYKDNLDEVNFTEIVEVEL